MIDNSFVDIFESKMVAVMLVNINNEILRVNDLCCKLLGVRKDDIVGTNWLEKNIAPADLKKIHESLKKPPTELEKKPERFELTITKGVVQISLVVYITHSPSNKSCIAEFIDVSKQRHQENKFQTIIEKMNEVITEIDVNGYITYVSPSTSKLFGYEPSYFIGKHCTQHIHPDYIEESLKILLDAFNGSNDVSSFIHQHEHKTKGYIWCQTLGNTIHDKDGKITGGVLVNRDISDLIDVQKTLKKQKDKYQTIVDTMTEMILEINNEGIVLFASPNTSTILGIEVDSIIGKTCLSGINLQDMLNFILTHDDIKKGKKTHDLIKYKYHHPSDGLINIEASTSPLFNDDNEMYGTLLVGRDVTEKERAMEEVRSSEQKLRYIYDNTSEAIFIAQDGAIVFCNKTTENLIGLPIDKIIGMKFDKFIHSEDRNTVVERHEKRLQNLDNNIINKYSFKVITNNSNVKYVDLTTVKVDWEGRPATLNLVSDISDKRIAEQKAENYKKELEIRNRQYQDILDTLQEGFYRCDKDSCIMFLSKSALSYLEIENLEQVKGKHISFLFEEKDNHLKIKKMLLNNTHLQDYDCRLKTLNNNIIDVSLTVKPIFNSNGIYEGSYGTFRDVTIFKKHQKELDVLYKVFENSQNALIVFGVDKKIKYANISALRLIVNDTGDKISIQTHIIDKKVDSFIYPDLVSLDDILQKLMEEDKWIGSAKVYSLLSNDGVVPVDIIFSKITYDNETLIVGSYYDVTEYKKMQSIIVEQAKNYVDITQKMEELVNEMSNYRQSKSDKISVLEQTLELTFKDMKVSNGQSIG